MIRLIIVALLSTQLYAEEMTLDELCKNNSYIAAEAMAARQDGIPFSAMIQLTGDNIPAQRIVIDAYRQRVAEKEEYKTLYIKDYLYKVYLDCYEDILIGDFE